MTSMGTARGGLIAATVAGRIYAIGGQDKFGSSVATNEEYNPATNGWAFKTSMPTPRLAAAAAVVNGKIYVIGGHIGATILATVEEYDPVTNAWNPRASMPTPRAGLGAAAVNGKIYAIGGSNGASFLATVQEYDPATNSWTTRAAMPTARAYLAAATVNGKIYAIGGNSTSGFLATVEEYDPVMNSWMAKTSMPTARDGLAATTLDGKVHAIGGVAAGAIFLGTAEEYDPQADTWAIEPSMPTARQELAAASLGESIYALGGSDDASTFATVERFGLVVSLTIRLAGVNTPAVRCIRFQADTCAVTDVMLAFDATGQFTGNIELQPGIYASLSAKDPQHTKWATVPLPIRGTDESAAATLSLECGDTDNDGDVDINDLTWLIAQFGQAAASGGCPWDGTRDADFSNDGAVLSEDYAFLAANWLTTSEPACAIPATWQPGGPMDRRAWLRVDDPVSRSADINGDGWVDHVDVRLFEDANGLPHELSETLRAATPTVR